MKIPKFVLSKSKVLEQYKKVEQISDLVSYSSKTNQEVTKILEKETKCMFSVHFENELEHIEDRSRVMFIAQGWSNNEIKGLIDKGIDHFIVDNESDLDVLLEFLNNYDSKINLLLRIKLKENTIRTEKYFVFGMNSAVVNKRIKELKNNQKIERLGIHFHRKTQNMSEWNLQYEITNILEEEVLNIIDMINIGGGIPSVYANTNKDVIKTVLDKIDSFKQWLNSKDIKMIAEPGRFIAAPAVELVTKIISISENNIIVNVSVYNTDMDAIIVPVKLLVKGEQTKENGNPYVIKGITPCSMDLFRYKAYLKDPKVGEELIFLNAGAYNFMSDFCDLKKIPTEVVE